MNTPILVYRNHLLPFSEVFIYNQTIRLKRYTAHFLGAKSFAGSRIYLPQDRQLVINQGSYPGLAREALFKYLGYIPNDVLNWVGNINPVLIHAHFGFDGAIALPLAKRLNVPLVVSFLGTDATMRDEYAQRCYLIQRLYLRRRDQLIKNTTRVIVPSKFLKDKVVEQGFPEGKISLIYHGVDLDECKIPVGTPIFGSILYVGRLIRRKGLPYLIEALKLVKDRYPQTELIVIGDGPERSEYEALARQYLGESFIFLGAQPHHVVREKMAQAYAFCMPSITEPSGEVETFGLVFAEAHAFGVPVVSFNSGAISEVVAHNETGFLAEEKNTAELAHYLNMLLGNPGLRNAMGLTGRRKVEQEFNLEVQNAKLEDLYDKLIASFGKV